MDRSRKILYLANLNPNKFGSMEEYALFLSRELRRRGYKCYLGFISEPEPGIRRRFEEAGATILTVYCGDTPLVGSRASLKLKEVLALRKMVVDNGIDIVHVNFIGLTNPILLGVYLSTAKIVFTEHASGLPLQRRPLKHLLSRCVHALISRRVSRYIAVSEYVRNRFRQTHHVSGEKTVTVYNGVNLERFSPRDIGEARRELGLPHGIPVVCSIAMLIPEKGGQYLIEAVALLVKEQGMLDLQALVVGEGGCRGELELLARELGVAEHVHFLGRRSDVQTIIAACDAVVVPSVWEEAFGLVIAESMASARPVVASRTGAIPELIEDGRTGRLVPVADAENLAATLAGLLGDATARADLAAAAHDSAVTNFNILDKVKELADSYDGLLNPW